MRRIPGLLAAIGLPGTLLPATVVAAKPIRDNRWRPMTSGWRHASISAPSRRGRVATGRPLVRAGHRLPWVASLGAASLLMVSGTAVMAAPARHTTTQQTQLGCDLLETEGASGHFSAVVSDSGAGADLQVWLPPASPLLEPPTLVTSGSVIVVADGGAELNGTVDFVWLETGASAGRAAVAATLTPVGTPETYERSTRGSNHRERIIETAQALSVAGQITLPGSQVLTLDGWCSGSSVTAETFENAPSSTVASDDVLTLRCEWYVDDSTYVGLAGETNLGLSYLDIAVVNPAGSFPGWDDDATLGPRGIEATFELAAAGQGVTATGGTAHAVAEVSAGARVSSTEGSGNTRIRTTIQEYLVAGTVDVSLNDGTAITLGMTDESCRMWNHSELSIEGGNG